MKELFQEHLGAFIATIITGFGGWFFGRKKADVDVDSVQIDNFDKGLLYYQKLVDDLGLRLEKAINALQKSEIEKQEVIKEFSEATHKIHELERTVENLTEELKKYKQLNGKTA